MASRTELANMCGVSPEQVITEGGKFTSMVRKGNTIVKHTNPGQSVVPDANVETFALTPKI